ncbi:MAG: hypothetical protein NT112_02355 [Methanoregula sp.]|nr:hypothetical protein [Methanoregula sp.]
MLPPYSDGITFTEFGIDGQSFKGIVRAHGSGLVVWRYAALFPGAGELVARRDGVPE